MKKLEWIQIKPLSVNQAYRGRRFKTNDYKKYEVDMFEALSEDIGISDKGQLVLILEVRYSSRQSDIDNCIKPFLDILQKRFGFNDNRVFFLAITKEIVPKGEEGIGYMLADMEEVSVFVAGEQIV